MQNYYRERRQACNRRVTDVLRYKDANNLLFGKCHFYDFCLGDLWESSSAGGGGGGGGLTLMNA